MAGNVKSEHGVFTGEAFFLAPGRGLTQFERHRRGGSGGSAQPVVAGLARSGSAPGGGDGLIPRGPHGFPRTPRNDGARLTQGVDSWFCPVALLAASDKD